MRRGQLARTGGVGTATGDHDGISVLHVDDDAQFGDLVATYLEQIDDAISVSTETDPAAVLDVLQHDPVDCVVSDYQMPGMDGIELLEAVRAAYPNLPFVLFTGKGSEAVASEAIDAGVTTYLQKNGTETYEILANRIQNAVCHHRSRRLARVTEDRLFGLYEQADGVYTLDEDWRITYWNQRIAERTGRPAAAVLGESYWEVFPGATDVETEERFRHAVETQTPVRFEVRYDPGGYWAEVRAFPIDEGLFVHSRDISDLKEREQEVEHRNQILESFASTVSHDLRNPLSVAEGNLELAQETGDFEHLDEVANAHNRMRNLIDDLLRIARGDDLALESTSLREGATRAWDTVSTEDVDLVVESDAHFEAHPSQLRRLFENLFWNAREHGGADAVRVGALDDGFYVEDDGRGIPAADREAVFEPGVSSADDGPGYGLHIVRTIADIHDWDVCVTESSDGGARFEVRGVSLGDD
jgi:PAS domain S-box-containing protein